MKGDRGTDSYGVIAAIHPDLLWSICEYMSLGIMSIEHDGKMKHLNAKGKEFLKLIEENRSLRKVLNELITKKTDFKAILVKTRGKNLSVNGFNRSLDVP